MASDLFDKRRERGRLALAHRPDHQKEPLLAEGKLLYRLREPQFGHGAYRARDKPQRDADQAALKVPVAPEARPARRTAPRVIVRKVYFLRFQKTLFKLGREHRVDNAERVLFGKHRLGDNRRHDAGDAHGRMYAGAQMQVARALRDGQLYQTRQCIFIIRHIFILLFPCSVRVLFCRTCRPNPPRLSPVAPAAR